MKNILYLHAGAELYGADIVMLELVKGLNKNEYNPIVVLPCNGPLVEKLKENDIDVEIISYPILRRKYFNPKGIIQYIFNYNKYSKKLVDFCKERDIDIIHINTSAVLEGCYLKKKTKLPVIWHIHEILSKPKVIVNFMFKSIVKYSDKIVCVSKAVEENLKNITNMKDNQSIVIYNGVDNNKFNLNNNTEYLRKEFNISDNDIVVGMIGRINAWKGQKDFINAMNIVFEKNKNVSIKAMLVGGVFEGQEWRIKELKEMINQSDYKDKYILSDFRNDSPNIHNLFDIFVLPSTNPDPLPTVVLEAMASAKPIIGYRHGGICEMVKENENGILCKPCDVKELANNINAIIQNKKLKCDFSNKSLERQKKYFSLNTYIYNFEKLYSIFNK